jgi:hypothetical protein
MRKRKWIISLLAESGRSIRVTFDFFISDLITKYIYICMTKLHFSRFINQKTLLKRMSINQKLNISGEYP